MLRFLSLFLLIQMSLFALELWQPVHQGVIVPFTALIAKVSAMVMQAFDADVISHGVVIQSRQTGFGVSIEAGCNGVEACIVLIAAVLAFPAPWKSRALALVVGLVAVQALNLVRIISLYYLGKWDLPAFGGMSLFEFAHLYLWQALIMLDVLVVWLLWVRYLAARGQFRLGAPHAA
ncbi:MAG: exosortase H [Burkholderiaceae bacterium]